MASSSKGKGSEEKETGLGLWPKITAPIDPDNCVKVRLSLSSLSRCLSLTRADVLAGPRRD